MSYELWCYKDRSTVPRPYILLDVNSETSSAASATIQDAFATFGISSVSMYQRSQAKPLYDITPISYLENYCNDHPELLI